MHSQDSVSEYFVRSDSVTLLQGKDSTNVIDRVVSTKIHDNPNSDSIEVLFCDYNGRVTDLGSIYMIQGKLLLLSSKEMGENTRKTLVDGKSWDEDCEVIIADEAIARVSLISIDTHLVLSKIGLDEKDVETSRIIEIDDKIVVKSSYPRGSVLDILLPRDQIDSLTSILDQLSYVEMNEDRWEYLRMGLCVPSLTDIAGRLPSECGMDTQISSDKGCYPGQEVHARLESRGRTVKRMCLISGESPITVGKHRSSNGSAVLVSSSISSPSESLAVAILRLDDIESGIVNIEGSDYTVDIVTYL